MTKVTKMIISVFDRVEKHCGKRRNCLYKQFLLFPQCFPKSSCPDPSKGVIKWEGVKEKTKKLRKKISFLPFSFSGVTLIKPEDLDFPNTMTDIEYDTWMLR